MPSSTGKLVSSSPATTKGDPEGPIRWTRPWRIVAGVLLGLSAILLLLALVSYSPESLPDWVPFAREASTEVSGNLLGPFGALAAGYAYFFFGAASYLVPPVLIWWAFQILSTRKLLHSRNLLALAGFLVAASCLLEFQVVLFQDWVTLYNLPGSCGGFFGQFVGRRFLADGIGGVFAHLLMTLVYFVSLFVIIGIHPIRLGRLIKQRIGEQTRPSASERPLHRKKRSPNRHRGRSRYRSRSEQVDNGDRELFPGGSDSVLPRQDDRLSARESGAPVNEEDDTTGGPPETGPAQEDAPTFVLPPLNLLDPPESIDRGKGDDAQLQDMLDVIVDTLKSFQVPVEPGDISRGPTVTRYEVYPERGLRVSRITALKADIARATRAEKINILAPIPGKDTVGIEIANYDPVTVRLRELFESEVYRGAPDTLPVAMGKDVYGETIVGDLAKMPHLLVAGSTGSGKSVFVNSLVVSLLYRFSPQELKFLMIDPKMVELQMYDDLPHMLAPVVKDPGQAMVALHWVVTEMERRYALFARSGSKQLRAYNEAVSGEVGEERLPYVVVLIDELADLMRTAPADIETAISRIAQKARAAGIHLIVATQTPRSDVITGTIKANIPSRVAFQVASKIDSRIILDENGAENLVGRGDMMYIPPGSAQMTRIQGAFLTEHEAEAVVRFWSDQGRPEFEIEGSEDGGFDGVEKPHEAAVSREDEELIEKCIELIAGEKRASTSMLQRKLSLGYNRAARVMDILEERGIIGPSQGAKPREILVDLSTE